MKSSLRQRSSRSWELTIDLGRRDHRYFTVRGTKAAAQRELCRHLSTLDRSIAVPDEKMPLRDWLDRWMREVIEPHRLQRTVERCHIVNRPAHLPHVGHVELARLAPSQVQTLESRLLNQGKSPQTVQLVHAVLSGALKHTLRMEIIHRSLVSVISPSPTARCEVEPPSLSTVRRALDLARHEGHHLHAAIHLIAYTGIRHGETLALSWPNVDLDNAHVAIEGSLVPTHREGLILQQPKTASGRRTVDLDEGIPKVLAKQDRIKAVMRAAYRGFVFAGFEGDWINPAQLTRAVKGGVPSSNPTPSRRAKPGGSTLIPIRHD